MRSEHERLVEAVAQVRDGSLSVIGRGLGNYALKWFVANGGGVPIAGPLDRHVDAENERERIYARRQVALIAELTKEATPEMIEAGRDGFYAGTGCGKSLTDIRLPNMKLALARSHAASSLYPPRAAKDVEGERG